MSSRADQRSQDVPTAAVDLPAAIDERHALPGIRMPETRFVSATERARMLAAAREVRECQRVLETAGLNVVSEVLRGEGDFVEMAHYPRDDVFDHEHHSQYYYHAHRPETGEHGHFHCFVRAGGMPAGMRPATSRFSDASWPRGDQAICHLVGIAMDVWGRAIGLFATNRWVTDETWYAADDAIALLDRFRIDHARPSWPTNRWISAMLILYRPHVVALLRHRDAMIAAWQAIHPDVDVLEDRRLDITGYLPISVNDWTMRLEAYL